MISKWTRRFLKLTLHVGEWSKDESTKVGSVIANGKFIVSLGFNGRPAGVIDPDDIGRDEKLATVIHSEVNAILSARQSLVGFTLYCSHPICSNCASVIIQSGITKVIVIKPEEGFAERWKKSNDLAQGMFKQAEVSYIEIDRGEL